MNKPIKHVLKGMPTGFYYPSEVDPYIKHLEQLAEVAEAGLAELVPEEMTPDMMKAVQCNSELGAYAAANLAGAYDLFNEFWKVARATMLRKIEEQSK